ncbi:alpha/beta hydrolase [Paenalcaligenes sp. Me52]|uniref:alpha/beta hydrolase n=1 Tax=Paenalcaligenes sp. Me52 TaxID=3392038 RepID=UPI003D268ED7
MKNVIKSLPLLLTFLCGLLLPNAVQANRVELNIATRPDSSEMYWTLDLPQQSPPTGILLLAQGSGCLSATKNENLLLARSYFPNLASLMVEKYGVLPGDTPENDHENCSDSFYAHHTVSQRVADYSQVLESLRQAPWWNGELVLLGGSEGGLVVSLLAEQHNPDATILLSTAGGMSFGDMVIQSMPKEFHPQILEGFQKARHNPYSTEKLAGQSLRFWADAIDLNVTENLLRSTSNILLLQGSADSLAPVEAARRLQEQFTAAGHCNLTYWEFPHYDHGMEDQSGHSHMPEVLKRAANWWLSVRGTENTFCTPK